MGNFGAMTVNDILGPLLYILVGTGTFAIFLKYLGRKILSGVISDITSKVQENISSEISSRLEEIKDELKEEAKEENNKAQEEIYEEIKDILDSHSIKCKSTNIEQNDQRYLLRQEFKMFLDGQAKTNEKLEMSISEIRNMCNQILLKLTD